MKTILNAFLMIVMLSGVAFAGLEQPLNYQLVQHNIQRWMKLNHVPGVAVLLYANGKPHPYYFGYAAPAKHQKVTAKTLFEIGSLTKLLTSVLIAEQVASGKMQLTDSIAHYLPKWFSSNRSLHKITLLNLETHTSGLPFLPPQKIKKEKQLTHYFRQLKLQATVGSQWRYSNINMGLLGDALVKQTKQSLSQLYQQRIFAPLHMSATGLEIPKRLMINYAQGFDSQGQPVPPEAKGLFPAAGDLKSSAEDMLNFLQASLSLAKTPSKIKQAMQLTQTPFVQVGDRMQALGWEVHSLNAGTIATILNPAKKMNLGPIPATPLTTSQQHFNGNDLIDKTGATRGFRAYIAVIPNLKSGIVILCNRYVSNGQIVTLGRNILIKLNNLA